MLTVLDIDHESRQDGDRWLRQWVLGLLAAIVLAGGSWWLQAVDARLSVQVDRQNSDRERLAAIEAQLRSQERRLDTIAEGLKEASERIDSKLDRITSMIVGQQGGGSSLGSRRFN